MATVGFLPVISPMEIKARVDALDRAILSLDADVTAAQAPRLDTRWRTAWHGFVRRWQIERDSKDAWDALLFPTSVLPRIEDFERNFYSWANEYEQRTGARATPIEARPDEPSAIEGIADKVILAGVVLVGLHMWFNRRKR